MGGSSESRLAGQASLQAGEDRRADSLPFLDRFSVPVGAAPEAAWGVTQEAVTSILTLRVATVIARLLGCVNTVPSGAGELAVGNELAGFRVHEAMPPRRLVLTGEHRLASYAFLALVAPRGDGGVQLAVETRARFKGRPGRCYRTVIVGSGLHEAVMRAVLWFAKRAAEPRV